MAVNRKSSSRKAEKVETFLNNFIFSFKNEKIIKTLEEKRADALEMATQENEKRKKKAFC